MTCRCASRAALAAWVVSSTALAFEPLFYVSEVKGTCRILLPDAQSPVPVEASRAYLYGSRLETGPDGEITLRVAERNECVIKTNSVATLTEDRQNPHWKSVKLETGRVDVRLESKFNEKNQNRLTVETAACVGEPTIGGEYSVTSHAGGDMVTCDFITVKGEMKLYDNLLFEMPAIKADNRVEVGISTDKQYTRLRVLKGSLLVDLKGVTEADGSPKVVKTQTDSILKLWRKSTPQGIWSVTTLVVTPKGGLAESFSYTVR